MKAPLKLVHVEDNAFERERIETLLRKNDLGQSFEVISFDSPKDFLKAAQKPDALSPHILLFDVDLGEEESGIELASRSRSLWPEATIIMCSAHDDVDTIKESMNSGADDFMSKKTDNAELPLRIAHAHALVSLRHGGAAPLRPGGFTGKTMEALSRRVPNIIQSAVSAVHISGESGTGKEVVADLFAQSLGPGKPFVKVNCGAIAPTLLERELFGHVKGAYTGASHDKRGFIEAASGGWIFLDEVATLSSTAQVALLRAIENQEVIRVGDQTPRKVNVRFISATNENLEDLVRREHFRQDLWQRLCEVELALPALRDRPGEIPLLVEHFAKHMKGGPYRVSPPALDILCTSTWSSGNIRELRNCLRAMTEHHVDKVLTPLSIPERLWASLDKEARGEDPQLAPPADGNSLTLSWPKEEPPLYDNLCDQLLLTLTRHCSTKGRISIRGLSKIIGVSRSTLSTRLRGLVDKGLIDLKELAAIVGISEAPSND